MKGILEKYKSGWFGNKSWNKKQFVIKGSELEVCNGDGGVLKSYPLLGAVLSEPGKEISSQREFAFKLTFSNGKELYLSTGSLKESQDWKRAITNSRGVSATTSSSSTLVTETPPPIESAQNSSSQHSVSSLSVILPDLVEVDGPAETGSELRCRAYPSASLLDSLCVSWFRLSSYPNTNAIDITLLPDFKLIQGMSAHTYMLTDEDIGKYVGCLCKPAVGAGLKWSILSDLVIPLDKTFPSARLSLIPHEHNKYCDRRVRVCTAPGRYREGEKIQLQPRGGPPGALANFRSVWYRSAVVDTFFIGTQHGASDGKSVSNRLDLSKVDFFPVNPRPVSDLAPAPPDYAPSPSVAEIRARLAPRLEPAAAPPAGFATYPIFKEDTGCMLLCALVPHTLLQPPIIRPRLRGRVQVLVDENENEINIEGVIVTRPVGPIEAAPPKAREIWIEGECKVGGTLRGNVYYFGGFEGSSIVSWVAIKSDGETEEVRAPTAISNVQSENKDNNSDPRELQLTDSLKGCMLKFRVIPVRSDGNAGHQETSRFTEEVRD
jgi:hypothetical protein